VDLGINAGVCQQTIERGHVRHGGRPPAFTGTPSTTVSQSAVKLMNLLRPACVHCIGEVRDSKLCSASQLVGNELSPCLSGVANHPPVTLRIIIAHFLDHV